MAIVPMKKFTLLTFQRYRDELLRQLQRFGELHLNDLKKEDMAKLGFLTPDYAPERCAQLECKLENVRFAIAVIEPLCEKQKRLAKLTAQPKEIMFDEFERFSSHNGIDAICADVRALDERMAAIKADTARQSAENENIRAWIGLDVAPAMFEGLESACAVLGTVSAPMAESFRHSIEGAYDTVHIELLGAKKGDMAVFALLPADGFDEVFARMRDEGFSRASPAFDELPSERISANVERMAALEAQRLQTQDELKQFTGELGNLKIACDCIKTHLERARARENFLCTDSSIVIEGWIPVQVQPALTALLQEICGDEFYAEYAKVDRDSPEIPVKLSNNRLVRAFEDVTLMYATPRYNEIDPTPLFMPFYMLFFGFMVGDTGFGLLLCAGTALALKFFALKDGARRFLQFFHYLSYGVIAAGVVYGSMFGFTYFAPLPAYDAAGTVIGFKPILDSMTDIPTMLILAVAIGVVQVVFGLLLQGYMLIREGKLLDALFDSLFWIVTLLGGIGYLLGATGALSVMAAAICKWCFFGGLVGLVLTQGRASQTIAGKIGTTLWNVYGISGYVGDLISYTRIVALALSGAFIGFSFIQMASILPEGAMRWIFGTVIVLLGQTLNFGLGLLGAYVHTCRLQYVEYFGKFYEGGGVLFKPFSVRSDHVKINK